MAALTAALIGLSAASTVTGFAGQRRAAGVAEKEGEYAQHVYGMNADLAEAQAADAIARGHEAALRQHAEGRRLTGAQKAGYASSGIDITSGTPGDVIAESAAISELDEIAIRNNAAREAYGFSSQAAIYRAQGAMALAAGSNQAKALRNQSVGTLLSGALDTYGMYSRTRSTKPASRYTASGHQRGAPL